MTKPFALEAPVSVLMPVCNEADVIRDVIAEWATEVFAFLPAGSELLFDDCSDDGTTEILLTAATEYPFIRIAHSPRDGFFATAMRLYAAARCPLVFFTDSDGQYVAQDFWRVAAAIAGNDMVHGVKVRRKDPGYRIYVSAMYNKLARFAFGSRCTDVNSAFRLMRRPMLDAILPDLKCLRMLPNSELYLRAERAGYAIENISVGHRHRKYGKSRSLPSHKFATECWRALRGLVQLRRELAGAYPRNPVTNAVSMAQNPMPR